MMDRLHFLQCPASAVCPSVCQWTFPSVGCLPGLGTLTAGGLWAPRMPRLAVLGDDLLSHACRVAEPGCQTVPVLAAPPHSLICEGQGPLRHSVLPLSNHLPGPWHYPSALLPQAAPQGFILPGDVSFVSPEQAGGAGCVCCPARRVLGQWVMVAGQAALPAARACPVSSITQLSPPPASSRPGSTPSPAVNPSSP